MAKLSNIPNELLVAISTHLRKPSDVLHLVLANRHTHGLIVPLLYENITIDHEVVDVTQFSALGFARLATSLRNNHVGQFTRTVEIDLTFASPSGIFQLSNLLQHLTALKRFKFNSSRRNCGSTPILLSPFGLVASLNLMSKTLTSLSICANWVHIVKEPLIGSLRHFTALRHLCINSLLIFEEGTLARARTPYFDKILAPSLEDLELHCHSTPGKSAQGKARATATQFCQAVAGIYLLIGSSFEALPALRLVTISMIAPGLSLKYPERVLGSGRAALGTYMKSVYEGFVVEYAKEKDIEIDVTVDETSYGSGRERKSLDRATEKLVWIFERKAVVSNE